jgi:hypothetical protein
MCKIHDNISMALADGAWLYNPASRIDSMYNTEIALATHDRWSNINRTFSFIEIVPRDDRLNGRQPTGS